MVGLTDGWRRSDGWTDRWRRLVGGMDRQMEKVGWRDGQTDGEGWVDGWMDGWRRLVGRTDRWRGSDGWMEKARTWPAGQRPPSHQKTQGGPHTLPLPPQVDGTPVPLPFCLQDRAVCVTPAAAAALLLLTATGLRVTAGPGGAVAVTVPSRYRNVTCGLCGNFDGRPANDHLHLVATVATCHRPCPGPACPPCQQAPKRAFVHRQLCGLLRAPGGPFGGCHPLVDPGIFYDVCLRELCEEPGEQEVLGEVVGAYEAACRQAGAVVAPWSGPKLCRELGTMGEGGHGAVGLLHGWPGCPSFMFSRSLSIHDIPMCPPWVHGGVCGSIPDVLQLSVLPQHPYASTMTSIGPP